MPTENCNYHSKIDRNSRVFGQVVPEQSILAKFSVGMVKFAVGMAKFSAGTAMPEDELRV